MTGISPVYRLAVPSDAEGMCAVLNRIIEIGGTTAHRKPFSPERMVAFYIEQEALLCCHVALRAGRVLGFQALKWCDAEHRAALGLPEKSALIATFVDVAGQGLGIGQGLFARTLASAEAAGVPVIDATIRKENTGGLKFYSRLGFEDAVEHPESLTKLYRLQ